MLDIETIRSPYLLIKGVAKIFDPNPGPMDCILLLTEYISHLINTTLIEIADQAFEKEMDFQVSVVS